MAVRIRSRFHTEGQRSAATLASVVCLLAWKLAVDAIKRMRAADYDIDIGRPYFDFVCEFLVFMAMAADRIAYMKLEAATTYRVHLRAGQTHGRDRRGQQRDVAGRR